MEQKKDISIEAFRKKAAQLKKENQKFYQKLRNRVPENLDEVFHRVHEEVFETTDCLSCANCCKTTSPIFYEKDIERASKALRMKPGTFTETFLKIDEDQDYVPNIIPCPFLENDNTCRIYESRPNACKEYPHTNRRKIHQITELSFRNTLVCPAVLEITERVKKELKR
ncbi:MAG TPA: YkgJ family cysteine cluster protein [Bacteroidia bacterium]|nr:YkgJ family cysteine cluster protein [Bacteroidia bacterium]